MKKLGMLSLIMGSLWLGGCSDDDKDFVLDVNRMTGVDWYYNRTTSKNYLSFSDENVLEINRFDKNGEIKSIDLRGVIDSVAGVWRDEGENVLAVDWKNGNSESWTVENCTSKKFVVNNGWGEREYITEPSYLENLTGDAFWVNKFVDKVSKLQLGFRISNDRSMRAGYVRALLSDDESVKLKSYNNVWKEEVDISRVEDRKVRFSCRIGGDYVKFDEFITADNFPSMRLDEVNFTSSIKAGYPDQLEIEWNEFEGENVYYKIEVYSKDNEADVYFESGLFPYDNGKYTLNGSTIGKINKLDKIDSKKEYVLRLTAVMLEPGVASNSVIAESRIQAVVMSRINACLEDSKLGLLCKEIFNCLSQFFRLFAMNPMPTLWEFDEAGSRKFFL